MSSKSLIPIRKQVIKNLRGSVLEIGFGTGLNLKHYSSEVTKLTTLDNNKAITNLANKKIQESPIFVENFCLSGENIPHNNDTFDHIVCTWTLCSIQNVNKALAEIYRVLKPNGHFHFVEHGLSPNVKIQKWQHLLNPLQNKVGDGCNINRNIKDLIVDAGFELDEFKTYYMPRTPAFIGFFYQGIAKKSR